MANIDLFVVNLELGEYFVICFAGNMIRNQYIGGSIPLNGTK